MKITMQGDKHENFSYLGWLIISIHHHVGLYAAVKLLRYNQDYDKEQMEMRARVRGGARKYIVTLSAL